MTGDAYEAGMARLAAMWPGRSPDEATAAVYAESLGHLDDSVWERAIELCLRECTFYPVPAEILQRADWLLTEAGILPAVAEDAWTAVLQVARSSRPGADDLLPDLSFEAVEMMGGIYALKLALALGQMAQVRRLFLTIYGAERQRHLRTTHALSKPLPASTGLLMAETIAHG